MKSKAVLLLVGLSIIASLVEAKSWDELSELEKRKNLNAGLLKSSAYTKSYKAIPDILNWGKTDNFGKKSSPINWLTTVKNQHLPQYCGSCWAQAITSTISDRINIQILNGIGSEVSISPQMLVSCSKDPSKELEACNGGDTLAGLNFVADNYLMDDACMPYVALDGDCSDSNKICFDNAGEGGGSRVADFGKMTKWSVKDVTTITEFFSQPDTTLTPEQQQAIIDKNTANMLDALQSGPIVCGISVPEDLLNWEGTAIYTNPVKDYYVHDISVVGYDKTTNPPHWIVRNSWGEPWGYNGFWNVEMGKGILGIELLCRNFTPIVKTDPSQVANPVLKKAWEDNIKPKPSSEINTRVAEKRLLKSENPTEGASSKFSLFLKYLKESSFFHNHSKAHRGCTKARWEDESIAEKLKGKKPYKMISRVSDFPQSLDYSNYKDRNILTWVVNQHLPVYCGSCYAQAAVSSFADRINKMVVDDGKFEPFGKVSLSVQHVLNCGIGTCYVGGSSLAVFDFFLSNYAVPWGCAVYTATSPLKADCSPTQVCSTCYPNKPCFAVDPIKYFAEDWGFITGPQQMKDQIMNYGPIQCSVMVTGKFWNWKGNGILSEQNWKVSLDHAITVVGWGYDTESKTEYWIMRNTWGTMWGDGGFAKVQMWKDNFGIESDCGYIIPKKLTN